MPIRGAKNPVPTKGDSPSGIFSSKGSQKKDPLGPGFKPGMTATAMDKPRIQAQGAIRFSLGRATTKEKLDFVLDKLPPVVERLRAMSPVYEKAQSQ